MKSTLQKEKYGGGTSLSNDFSKKKGEEIENYSMREGAVTFLDVLGWIGIWKTDKNAIRRLSDLIKELKKRANDITRETVTQLDGDETIRGRDYAKITKVISISDTIVFLTDLEAKDALEIHGRLCQTAIANSIKKRIPLRGATTYGRYGDHDNILIGPAVDEAAAWHENQDWFGCILTPTAFFLNCHYDIECWKEEEGFPIKNPKGIETAAVDWTSDYVDLVDGTDPEGSLRETFREMGPIIPSIALKYANTLKYFQKWQKP